MSVSLTLSTPLQVARVLVNNVPDIVVPGAELETWEDLQ